MSQKQNMSQKQTWKYQPWKNRLWVAPYYHGCADDIPKNSTVDAIVMIQDCNQAGEYHRTFYWVNGITYQQVGQFNGKKLDEETLKKIWNLDESEVIILFNRNFVLDKDLCERFVRVLVPIT